MTTLQSPSPVQLGEPAPDFRLPAVHRTGEVCLADYRGQPLFLAIFLGLWCPFCRRNIVQLGTTRERLLAQGVETLGVVATAVDNARLYFKHRPARVPLAADSALVTHHAYGLPRPQVNETTIQALASTRINPTGELPEPVSATEIGALLDSADNYHRTDVDSSDLGRQWPMLRAQFLMDHRGIVRWINVECAKEGLAGMGKFPTTDEVLAAATELKDR